MLRCHFCESDSEHEIQQFSDVVNQSHTACVNTESDKDSHKRDDEVQGDLDLLLGKVLSS